MILAQLGRETMELVGLQYFVNIWQKQTPFYMLKLQLGYILWVLILPKVDT